MDEDKRTFDMIVADPTGASVLTKLTADDFQRVINEFYALAKDGASKGFVSLGGGCIRIYERGEM